MPWKAAADLSAERQRVFASAIAFVVMWAAPARAQTPEPVQKYQAVLQVGAVRGDGSTSPLAALAVETGQADVGAGVHLSLDFDLRREPLLAMLKPGHQPLTPAYLNGWTTSTSLRFAHASASSEVAVVGRVGSSRLDSATGTAANDIGSWAAFFDARVELRWYRQDMPDVYRSGQALMPVVQAYGGVRHDQRFHRAGDLAGFNDPTGRWFFGSVLMPLRVPDNAGEGRDGVLFTFGGGFEFETALRATDRLPSGLKILIRGDLDLGRALRRKTRT